jgi:hypothetical protein
MHPRAADCWFHASGHCGVGSPHRPTRCSFRLAGASRSMPTGRSHRTNSERAGRTSSGSRSRTRPAVSSSLAEKRASRPQRARARAHRRHSLVSGAAVTRPASPCTTRRARRWASCRGGARVGDAPPALQRSRTAWRWLAVGSSGSGRLLSGDLPVVIRSGCRDSRRSRVAVIASRSGRTGRR